jgi:hypothetical protein
LVRADSRDSVSSQFMLLAAAMGVERQLVVSEPAERLDLDPAVRSMTLNPRLEVQVAGPRLAVALNQAAIHTGQFPYLLVDVTHWDRNIQRRVDHVLRALPEAAVRFHSNRAGGVVSGRSRRAVLSRAKKLGEPAGAQPGAHVNVAAAWLLADYLAHARAWRPSDDRVMPRAPKLLVRPAPPAGCARRRVRLLLVGGGGALAHGFLEALLRDPVLVGAFAEIAIVDPDRYEASNLNRQTLASPDGLGQSKASVTAASLARLWPGPQAERPRLIPVSEPISVTHVERFAPDVVGLFADNARARSVAYQAARQRPGTLVLYAGTEFTYAFVRAVVTGATEPCLDCGPEWLAAKAEREREREEQRASCGHEVTSSNVLSNALAGAICAEQLRRYLASGQLELHQQLVNWRLPERLTAGPPLPSCGCSRHGGSGLSDCRTRGNDRGRSDLSLYASGGGHPQRWARPTRGSHPQRMVSR